MSLSSRVVLGSSWKVARSSLPVTFRTRAWTVRVPCLMSTLAPSRSGLGESQHRAAYRSAEASGMVPAAAMVSPRATSNSSARRSATDCGATASVSVCPVVAVAGDVETGGDGVGRQRALRPDDELDGEAETLQVAFQFVRGGQCLKDFEQGRPPVPGCAVRTVHDVVAVER